MKLARSASRQYHLVKTVQAESGRVNCDDAGYIWDEPRARTDDRGSVPFRRDCSHTVAKPLDGARSTWTTLEYRPSL